MHRRRIKFLIIVFIASFLNARRGAGQDIIGVVDYMKVDDHAAYLELERDWKRIHEIRFKHGIIIGWGVYQVMFNALDNPYNFVTISWYDSFSKLDKEIPEEVLKEAFPEKSETDWEAFYERTERSRKMLTSGVFQQQLSCSNRLDPTGKYYMITEINVPRGQSKEYLEIKENIYKPLFEEAIRNKKRVSWSLWANWPGNTKGYHYISADGYASLEQIDEMDYVQYFRRIHPNKNLERISQKLQDMETMVGSEMWKMIYRVYE